MCTPSRPRPLKEDEWPGLRTAVNQIFRASGGDLTAELPLLFDPRNRANLHVIVRDDPGADGEGASDFILAHAGFAVRDASVLRRKIRVACVGAVFTVPEQRGRGLATRVLAQALDHARQGSDLVMASGDGGLYRGQGLDPVPPLARFRLPEHRNIPAGLEIRDVAPVSGAFSGDVSSNADLNALAALYDAEDVHFTRAPADWEGLCQAGRLVDAPARFTLILRGGRAVAYIVAQQAGRRSDGTARPRRILEFAGDRDTILNTAPTLAEELLVPPYDTSTISLCERRGWPRAARQFLITAQALTAAVVVIPWYGLNYL